MDLVTDRPQRLFVSMAVLAGGAICGGLLGTIATAVSGGIVANEMLPHHLNHNAVRLRGSGDKLANHDLTQATGFAIALIIKAIAEAGTYPQSTQQLTQLEKKQLTELAEGTLKVWQAVAQELEAGKFELILETGTSDLFKQGTVGYVNQKVLEVENWRELLYAWLCPQAGVDLPEYVLAEVATQLRDKFALALREVLKADFEAGGKAFAGLTLSLLGEIRGVLAELQQSSPEGVLAELGQALGDVEQLRQELAGNGERFRELGRQIDAGFGDVLHELGVTQAQIAVVQLWLREELSGLKQDIKEGFATTNEKLDILIDGFNDFKKGGEATSSVGVFYSDDLRPQVTNFQGRQAEKQRIQSFLDDENENLIIIFGIAGMGKTSLAVTLFNQQDDFQNKFWADLRNSPSFSILAQRILKQLWQLESEELLNQKLNNRGFPNVGLQTILIKELEVDFLLVLDNFESVLHDAEYQGFLLLWLETYSKTKIIVTTQEIPTGIPHKIQEESILRLNKGLSIQEGIAFLTEEKVKGSEAELQEWVEIVQGHPLTLKFVGSYLAEEDDDEKITSFKEELKSVGIARLMEHPQIKGRHHAEEVQLVAVLDASFNRLAAGLRGVLLSLVVLRGGFDAGVASAMVGEEVTGKVLRGLMRRGFLLEEQRGFFTFQPFIGEYLKFKVGDLREAHLRAIEFYQSRFKSRGEWETVEDVREYLEVFYHRCELGDYEAAFDVIYDGGNIDQDVDNFLNLRGNNLLRVELYQQLVKHLPDHHNWRYTASLTSLGNAYESLGRYQEAIAFYEQSLEIQREIGNRRGEASSLMALGNSYQKAGRIKEGFAAVQQGQAILQELDLPLDAYPYPKWAKAIGKFAQRSTFNLILCFILGLFAFPFALIWIIALTLYRIIRNLFPHP
ncbi:NB-ARC domain-containing protein [Spirulina sp. CCNP1310]|uniref:tetratricopeptide repeat protein n=1 Tax=Spirulina sp. CCNP1310 TaxID=3110249 RepID=UPI002B20ED64|nr:NB-ARC domain-containing protein [Spirulina sp. CCNP1310]MEA5420998.1 NB-ARC domain-containing protein [Spirulina sp. CCNP1310]